MSDVAAVTPSTISSDTTRSTGTTLGKDDFLKLLTTQLQYQDPLNPMNDQDFIGQMAQFSSLEQMTNVADSVDQMGFADQVTQAVSLIGRTVEWEKDGQTASSSVDSVSIQDGAIQLNVGSDTISPSQVSNVK